MFKSRRKTSAPPPRSPPLKRSKQAVHRRSSAFSQGCAELQSKYLFPPNALARPTQTELPTPTAALNGIGSVMSKTRFSRLRRLPSEPRDKNGTTRGDLMASKSLTFFDKKNLNWGGLKSGKKLSSVICSFTQQGHFVMSSCPKMKPENVISSPPRVEKRVFQLLRF